MKLFIKTLVALLFFAALILLAAPFFINWNNYKPLLEKQAESITGFDVTIQGDLDFQIFPYPGVSIENITAKNPGFDQSTPSFFTVERSELLLSYLALLKGDIVFNSISLIQPQINLIQSAQGERNWQTNKLLALFSEKKENVGKQKKAEFPFKFEKIQIDDALISYRSEISGQNFNLDKISLNIRSQGFRGPFHIKGSSRVQGEVVKLEVQTEKLAPSSGSISLTSRLNLPEHNTLLSFSGALGLQMPLDMQGELEAVYKDAKTIALLFDPSIIVADKLSMKSFLTFQNQKAVLNNMRFIGGGENISSGNMNISLSNNMNNQMQTDVVMALNAEIDVSHPRIIEAYLKSGARQNPVDKKVSGTFKSAIDEAVSYLSDYNWLKEFIKAEINVKSNNQFWGKVIAKNINNEIKLSRQSVESKLEIENISLEDQKADLEDITLLINESNKDAYEPGISINLRAQEAQPGGMIKAYSYFSDKPSVPQISLQQEDRFFLNANALINKKAFRLDEFSLQNKGKSSVRASGEFYLEARSSKSSSLKIKAEHIDVSPYIKVISDASQDKSKSVLSRKDVTSFLKKAPFLENVDLELQLNKVQFRTGQPSIGKVEIKALLEDNVLQLKKGRILDWHNVDFTVSGNMDLGKNNKYLSFDAKAESKNIEPFLRAQIKGKDKGLEKKLPFEATLNYSGGFNTGLANLELQIAQSKIIFNGSLQYLQSRPNINDSNIAIMFTDHPDLLNLVGTGFNQKLNFSGLTDLKAGLSYQKNRFHLTDIKGKVSDQSVLGEIVMDYSQSRPFYEVTLKSNNLKLENILSGLGSAGTNGKKRISNQSVKASKWSRNALDLEFLRTVDFKLSSQIDTVSYKGNDWKNVILKSELKQGNLELKGFEATQGKGKLLAQGSFNAGADSKHPLDVDFVIEGKSLASESLMPIISGNQQSFISGPVNFATKVTTRGLSPATLIYGLSGQGQLNGENIIIRGLDISSLTRGVSQMRNLETSLELVKESFRHGSSRFEKLEAGYDIKEGVVIFNKLEAVNPETKITGAGTINLPAWQIDLDMTLSLLRNENAPDINFSIKGPLDQPARTFASGPLKSFLKKKLKHELESIILDKLKLSPRQQPDSVDDTNSPAATPSNDNDNQSQQESQQDSNKASGDPSQETTQSPEEKVIRGVLDSILR